MIEDRLLAVAYDLCRKTGRRPREAFMRRSVSTAYYAVFHALARSCADGLIGARTPQRRPAWDRVYRALAHNDAKRTLLSKEAVALSPAIERFGNVFAKLQQNRYEADYNPTFFSFFFDETRGQVDIARDAIADLRKLDAVQRAALATLVLFRPRASGPRS